MAGRTITVKEEDYLRAKEFVDSETITMAMVFEKGIEPMRRAAAGEAEPAPPDMKSGGSSSEEVCALLHQVLENQEFLKKYLRRMFRELCMFTDADVRDPDFDISELTRADDEIHNRWKYGRRVF